MTVEHPAKFNTDILRVISGEIIDQIPTDPERFIKVLDPFAGVGLVHNLARMPGVETWGIEIEPEWATQHPRTIVGDATTLPFPDASFDLVVTSPTYGNRMADHHNAQERCKPCGGTGRVEIQRCRENYIQYRDEIRMEVRDAVAYWYVPCEKCDGAGRRQYKRLTYRHTIGRPLHPKNSGQMQWGPKYRALHEKAWAEVDRVLKPEHDFILNFKNHYRTVGPKGDRQQVEQDVLGWHLETLGLMGFEMQRVIPVETQGMGFGANRDVRTEHEVVAVLRKAA